MQIDVWSDVACPWCWIGKRHLEQALEQFEHADEVEIHWKAFELDPGAPAVHPPEPPFVERLAKKYRASPAQAQAMIDRMAGVAQGIDLTMDFSKIAPGNTFDAHRLLHLAGLRGCQNKLKEQLFEAYFAEGVAIGDKESLVPVAVAAGLDEAEVREVLEGDRYADEVRADEAQAGALGVTGVPFFVLGERFGFSGAQPVETLVAVLRRAWAETQEPEPAIVEGAACGPAGC